MAEPRLAGVPALPLAAAPTADLALAPPLLVLLDPSPELESEVLGSELLAFELLESIEPPLARRCGRGFVAAEGRGALPLWELL